MSDGVAHAAMPLRDDNPSKVDLLAFEDVVDVVESIVTRADLDPVTVGISAPWGGGKTTVLQLLKRRLDAREDLFRLLVSPREYDNKTDPTTALIDEVLGGGMEARPVRGPCGRGAVRRGGAWRADIVLIRFPLDTADVDAFSLPFHDRPVVVLGADKNDRARSRFDGAHELGHLVIHGDQVWGVKEVERQAHGRRFRRTAVVDLAVTVTYGDPVRDVARKIQRHVIASLREHTGLQTVTVDVTVDDILTDDDQLAAGIPAPVRMKCPDELPATAPGLIHPALTALPPCTLRR